MKTERKTYYLHSGENFSDAGAWEVVTMTEIGIKRRLTKERRGDRWAQAYTVEDDSGRIGEGFFIAWDDEEKRNGSVPTHLVEKARREKSEIKRAGRPKMPKGTRIIDLDTIRIYLRADEIVQIDEAARAANVSRQIYLHSKIFG